MTSSIQDDLWMKVREVAEYLRVSKMTVYRLIHGHELEAIRIGRTFRVSVREADRYLRKINTANREEN